MALSKPVPTSVGVDATYWRIVSIDVQHDAGVVCVWLRGYANQAARDAGRDPLPDATRIIRVAAESLPGGTHAVSTADLYAEVKNILNAAPATLVGRGPGQVATLRADSLAGAADV